MWQISFSVLNSGARPPTHTHNRVLHSSNSETQRIVNRIYYSTAINELNFTKTLSALLATLCTALLCINFAHTRLQFCTKVKYLREKVVRRQCTEQMRTPAIAYIINHPSPANCQNDLQQWVSYDEYGLCAAAAMWKFVITSMIWPNRFFLAYASNFCSSALFFSVPIEPFVHPITIWCTITWFECVFDSLDSPRLEW